MLGDRSERGSAEPRLTAHEPPSEALFEGSGPHHRMSLAAALVLKLFTIGDSPGDEDLVGWDRPPPAIVSVSKF